MGRAKDGAKSPKAVAARDWGRSLLVNYLFCVF
jgi:hypothetical protein